MSPTFNIILYTGYNLCIGYRYNISPNVKRACGVGMCKEVRHTLVIIYAQVIDLEI